MAKTRMQILLEKDQKKALEREAEARNISVGQLIREAVEFYQQSQSETEGLLTKEDSIWNMVGTARSAKSDLSQEHDRYLYGAQNKQPRTKR